MPYSVPVENVSQGAVRTATRLTEGHSRLSPRFWMITSHRRDVENLNGERGPLTYAASEKPQTPKLISRVPTGIDSKLVLKQANVRARLETTENT